jgi:Holliday junction resolvase-like predicted endonuclease
VKYRRNFSQGGGIAAITPKKLQQMKFAAELFITRHKLENYGQRLAVASLTGDAVIDQYLEIE